LKGPSSIRQQEPKIVGKVGKIRKRGVKKMERRAAMGRGERGLNGDYLTIRLQGVFIRQGKSGRKRQESKTRGITLKAQHDANIETWGKRVI